jgi:hypothetical protein
MLLPAPVRPNILATFWILVCHSTKDFFSENFFAAIKDPACRGRYFDLRGET